MKLYSLASSEAAQACRQLIRLSNDCASLQWSQTIRDIPDDILDALDMVKDFTESRLEAFCTEGKLVRALDEGEDALWHQCARSSETMRQILGSCVILSGKEAQEVRESLKGTKKLYFITEELRPGQSLVLL